MINKVRLYAGADWLCRKEWRELKCICPEECKEMYPNLKCHKNER